MASPSSLAWWLSPKSVFQILFINCGLFFQSTCAVLTLMYSLLIYPFSFKYYRQFISWTMAMWSLNLVALVQWFAPASLVMTFDQGLEDMVNRGKEQVSLSFPERIILLANHQIYADWIYIWCVAHVAGAHGVIKIILKHSLKNLPVYGLKLALDQDTIVSNLARSKKIDQPMWLVLFPEGTVVSECTRKKSKEYAEKNNLKDNRYTLLPRSTGLKLCTTTLDDSVEYMYDFSIGYSGVGPNEIPEKVYTIQSIFFFHHYPQQIHIHVRRFKIADIPRSSDSDFNQWMHDRWVEKDALMGHFYKEGRFPGEESVDIPIKQKSNLELCKMWMFLIPYVWLAKVIIGYLSTAVA